MVAVDSHEEGGWVEGSVIDVFCPAEAGAEKPGFLWELEP